MRKRLLFVNGHLNTGGVEKSLLDILKHLDYEKYDVDLLLFEELGDYISELPEQVNVIFKSIEGTYGSFFKVMKQSFKTRDWFSLKMRLVFCIMKLFGQERLFLAKKILTENKCYDCAIGFRPGFCTQVAAYAVNADKKITWWHHGEISIERNSYLEAAEEFNYIVAVSDYCNRMLAAEFPSLVNKTVTIHNMIDSDTIISKAMDFNPSYEDEKIHIVSVGRLAPEKHFDNTIYAAKTLKEHGYIFKWHLIGDGMLREELENKALELGVQDCFVFEGNQVNPYPYIKNADLFVHPSYIESFGLVVAEALCLGVPCVVTKSEGVLELVREGYNGVLTERNREDLAKKVLKLLDEKELLKTIKANSFCPTNVTPDKIIGKIDNIIEELL